MGVNLPLFCMQMVVGDQIMEHLSLRIVHCLLLILNLAHQTLLWQTNRSLFLYSHLLLCLSLLSSKILLRQMDYFLSTQRHYYLSDFGTCLTLHNHRRNYSFLSRLPNVPYDISLHTPRNIRCYLLAHMYSRNTNVDS